MKRKREKLEESYNWEEESNEGQATNITKTKGGDCQSYIWDKKQNCTTKIWFENQNEKKKFSI